jgi:hypothetical protein
LFYRGVIVNEEECEFLSVEEDGNNLDFSNGFRAFSIHSNHLNKRMKSKEMKN